MVRTKLGTFGTLREAIDAEWTKDSLSMDWLGMETCIRLVLATRNSFDNEHNLELIDEIVAAFTRRGSQIGKDY